MARFEREKPDPAKFKVGDKIMGYHFGSGVMILVAGEVVKVDQPLSFFSSNSYDVLLMKDLDPELKDGATFSIKEDEAVPLNEERLKKAIVHWQNEMRLRAESGEEHLLMLKELYPEDYSQAEGISPGLEEKKKNEIEKKNEEKK